MPISAPVSVSRQQVVLPTYEPHAPDRNPMFLEKRVYQGSSGRVYPLPCTDRITEKPVPRLWEAVFIENEFIRVMILPELGGRIHRAQDKTNGYDFVYYQPLIKPALVGLAGTWASGGIEFNWPQHHRPSTFMPTDVAIEKHPDGSATVWLSEHDPMARMKGMHGVRLHPGKACLEVVARAYNRTPDVQTFLWWANVAMRVHEQYQTFFPPDVTHVADHAKRATATFPLCDGEYYGVNYGARARNRIPDGELPRQFRPPLTEPDGQLAYAPNDLSWYANIPVPTSYMCMGSQQDFAGGYDHKAHAGIVHIANHHISPGKKQWTWGNHEFGYAWDRNLTAPNQHGEYAPYVELMSGVYTDNQPDFSYLQPGETKTWSQFWYPIRNIGPAQHASVDGAISLHLSKAGAQLGVAVTAVHSNAIIRLEQQGRRLRQWTQRLAPDQPFTAQVKLPAKTRAETLTLRVLTRDSRELLAYTPKVFPAGKAPAPAQKPPAPSTIKSADELFVIGLHLEQYRHATLPPEIYWREALRRDPGDSRCNLALGRWHLRRGELTEAKKFLRASIARLTSRNPNPYDGEAYYQLGLCLRQQALATKTAADHDSTQATARSLASAQTRKNQLLVDAYAAFYKATWNQAWQSAGYHALAEIDASRGDWTTALGHLDRALRLNTDNLRAHNLKVIALRKLGRHRDARQILADTLTLDPLEWWARSLRETQPASLAKLRCDNQVRLDLALDYARSGLFREALAILADATSAQSKSTARTRAPAATRPDASLGTEPLVHYYRAWLCRQLNEKPAERRHLAAAVKANPDYCFPARLEEIAILRHAIAANPRDARAPFYLGNLLYDRRRHREAITLWERAVKLEPDNAVAWRNLGIAYFNITAQPAAARRAYERAFRSSPRDGRLLYERDQLWKRLGDSPAKRLRELNRHLPLVRQRDDLSIELCTLFNQAGQPEKALSIIAHRKFQPWEGGEGQSLGQHARTHLALGRRALRNNNAALAIRHFECALTAPENLGEARHLLANQSDIHYLLGCARAALGDGEKAQFHWAITAETKGDFQTMRVQTFSEMTYYSALALEKLGRKAEAKILLRGLLAYARQLARSTAGIDYFATSLPTMLLFNDDLQARQETTALFLEAQARLGLGQSAAAKKLLRTVLQRDPNHALAADLLAST